MTCRACSSENQQNFSGEWIVAFPGIERLSLSPVYICLRALLCLHGQNLKLPSGAMLRTTYGHLRVRRLCGSGKNRNQSQTRPLWVDEVGPQQFPAQSKVIVARPLPKSYSIRSKAHHLSFFLESNRVQLFCVSVGSA
jgi:hypothetical protein